MQRGRIIGVDHQRRSNVFLGGFFVALCEKCKGALRKSICVLRFERNGLREVGERLIRTAKTHQGGTVLEKVAHGRRLLSRHGGKVRWCWPIGRRQGDCHVLIVKLSQSIDRCD